MLTSAACVQSEYMPVGPNWAAVAELEPEGETFDLETLGVTEYRLGDEMRFLATSARDGYLWIVQVGPDDSLSQLYPNDYSGDNRVRAGQITIVHPREAEWGLEAVDPVGKSIVAFVVTTDDMGLDPMLDTREPQKGLLAFDAAGPWAIQRLVISVTEN
jgi:hypothetical protein